ncbi:MAG TPA: P-II family nitrogen regulator [Candidatus Nitrosopolaris sp.]|nr:P-II family nitrogen regulator [Candidatus Nitrosopolaris sp.]
MKKIEAVFPSGRLDKAFAALEKEDIGGLTYFESKGRGQLARPQLASARGTSTFIPEFNANSTMVVVVKDSVVDRVVSKILEVTSTGMAGEGKIFVSEVDDAVDIGSKVRGESSI